MGFLMQKEMATLRALLTTERQVERANTRKMYTCMLVHTHTNYINLYRYHKHGNLNVNIFLSTHGILCIFFILFLFYVPQRRVKNWAALQQRPALRFKTGFFLAPYSNGERHWGLNFFKIPYTPNHFKNGFGCKTQQNVFLV